MWLRRPTLLVIRGLAAAASNRALFVQKAKFLLALFGQATGHKPVAFLYVGLQVRILEPGFCIVLNPFHSA